MLKELFIENLVLIERCNIIFEKGFNVFTGETGSGKSIVIDAIVAILGGRITRDIVRQGKDKTTITAVFREVSDNVFEKLKHLGYDLDPDEEFIIKREITSDGKSSARICGRPITATLLKEITINLINIHGQNDNQILLTQDNHIDILDLFSDNSDIIKDYYDYYNSFKLLKSELKENLDKIAIKGDKLDFYRYQIEEIENANVQIGEINSLESQRKLISNYSNIVKCLNDAHCSLQGDVNTDGAVNLISNANLSLDKILEYSDDFSDIFQKMESIYFEITEIASDISKYINNVDYDLSSMQLIEDRLDILYKLKNKYGNDEKAILDYYFDIKKELNILEESDFLISELEKNVNKSYNCALEKASKISLKRRELSVEFENLIKYELKYLDMNDVDFVVAFDKINLTKKGLDKVEFLISTNAGDSPKSISKIASGGELSRIMLAIKTVLAEKDDVNTLIFDEVDTGISGRAASKVGVKLSQISKYKQVICVTHLSQIAALADNHLLIEKNIVDNKTYTNVKKLNDVDRKYEIARIIGSDKISSITLDAAQEMLNDKNR